MFRLLKKPEISLADKRGTIMVEQDEKPGINAYFTAKESEVKGTNSLHIKCNIMKLSNDTEFYCEFEMKCCFLNSCFVK